MQGEENFQITTPTFVNVAKRLHVLKVTEELRKTSTKWLVYKNFKTLTSHFCNTVVFQQKNVPEIL